MSYQGRVCSGLEFTKFREVLESYYDGLEEASRRINEYLTSYSANVRKFLIKIRRRDIVEELDQLSPSIMNLKAAYDVLVKLDDIISKELEKLPSTEREVLEKVLKILFERSASEKSSPVLELDHAIKVIGDEPDKLRALANICRHGILRCTIGV